MNQHFWFLIPILVPLAIMTTGCTDNQDGDDTDALSTEVREAATELRDGAASLSNDIRNGLEGVDHDLARVDHATRARWNEECRQLTEAEADQSTRNELRDVCGDLKQGLDENSRDLVDRARDALQDIGS